MRGPGLALVGLLGAMPRAAAAEEGALIAIRFGSDRIEIAAGEVQGVELRANGFVPSLVVTLDAAVAPRLSALTGAHVGQEGEIRVCGQVVSRPVLRGAIEAAAFVISDDDAAEIRRLAAVLSAQDCMPGA